MKEDNFNVDEEVTGLLSKSIDSAKLAVQIYNNPFSKFRSESYIIHMIVAWNGLLQAIFLRKGDDIYEKGPNNQYIIIGERRKRKAIERLLNSYYTNSDDPVYHNIDFIIKLRNEIEHEIDVNLDFIGIDLFGECQSLLLNYEDLILNFFGKNYRDQLNLNLAIQFSKHFKDERISAQIDSAKKGLGIRSFIDEYRKNISDEIYSDQRYRFSIFLIPRVNNNRHLDDIPVLFSKNIKLSKEQMSDLPSALAVKYENIPSQDLYSLRPSDVVKKVMEKSKRTDFNIHQHTKCWVKYNSHPRKKTIDFKN
jgi:hypothetical protein